MEKKNEILEKSKILKDKSIELFQGEDEIHSVYGLICAASEIIQEGGYTYDEALIRVISILYHMKDCKALHDGK